VREAMDAVNWLSGAESSETCVVNNNVVADVTRDARDDDGLRDATVRYVEGLAELQQPTDSCGAYSPPQTAFREVLRDRCSGYRTGAVDATVAPYSRGLVSLPEEVASSPPIAEVVGPRGRWYLEGVGERMRPVGDAVPMTYENDADRCYVDPCFRTHPRIYGRFVRDLRKRGLVSFSRPAHERVGVFFL